MSSVLCAQAVSALSLSSTTTTTAAAAAVTDPTSEGSRNKEKKKNDPEAYLRKVYGSDDALFGAIEASQEGKPFGSLLDAGTGLHSLRWISTLATTSKGLTDFVAVTADDTMQRQVQREAEALDVDQIGKIVIGNWFHPINPLNFPPHSFDTILVDYLIGAMDGFSPYQQDEMLPKLAPLLKPGGRMYIIGLEPIPDSVATDHGDSEAANVMCRVRQIRDACILLAGHRCYREYPLPWIERHMDSIPSLQRLQSKQFPIRYTHETILKQINVGRSKLSFFPPHNSDLRTSMAKLWDDLERQSRQATRKCPNGRFTLGFDYVVTATTCEPQPADATTTSCNAKSEAQTGNPEEGALPQTGRIEESVAPGVAQ